MYYYIDGNDARMQALLKLFEKDKKPVKPWRGEAQKGDVIIFSPAKKWTAEEAQKLPGGVHIFAGKAKDDVLTVFKDKESNYINVLKNQSFAIQNANLTAEGVLALLLTETLQSVYRLHICILGLGRCGKAQALLFDKLGLKYDAVAFTEEDFLNSALYTKTCYTAKNYKEHLKKYDVIINNVPEEILQNDELAQIQPGTLLLEVASVKCLNESNAQHIQYLLAPALPTKVACQTAAEIFKQVILGGTL